MRKLKIDKSETHKPSNYIDVYVECYNEERNEK